MSSENKSKLIHLAWIIPVGLAVIVLLNVAAYFAISFLMGPPQNNSESQQQITVRDPDVIRFVLPKAGMDVEADPEAAFAQGTTVLNALDIKTAEAQYVEGKYVVAIEFNDAGTSKLSEITEENVGGYLGIVANGELISFPMISSKITDGLAVIEGGFTVEQAKELANLINQNL